MLFNSLEYLFLFLPVTLVIFLLLSRSAFRERQLVWLVGASLVFYASWNPVYVLLIAASIVVNYTFGRLIARAAAARVKPWLVAGVCFNLGLLGYFKYTDFFLEGVNAFGLWLIPLPSITLPLAISFFTFQQIAYLVDVARRDCREYQFGHYALFVLFFPQLIAGPIVHHKEMMPQFAAPRDTRHAYTDFAVGLTFIAIGLVKKVLLADSLASIADPVFSAAAGGGEFTSLDALLAIFAFSFQIYFDFSGYSDIAIGSARLFGIRLPENFRSPYKASSVIEIWHRWHMTLSRFLRDYLYFSLGGNRRGVFKRYRNLMLTMLLGGLWHGAAWTFVIWGGLHGAYLCINHGWRNIVGRAGLSALFGRSLFRPLFVLLTFIAWSIAMAIFRAPDVASAWAIISAGFGAIPDHSTLALAGVFADSLPYQAAPVLGLHPDPLAGVWLVMLAATLVSWTLPNSQEFLLRYDPVALADNPPLACRRLQWRPSTGFAVVTGVLLTIAVLNLGGLSRFIYFQF